MTKLDDTQEMFKLLLKSFEPSYIIKLSEKNKVTNFDKKLILDFFKGMITDPEDLIGLNIVKLIRSNRNFRSNFAATFADIINNQGIGLCAINALFNHDTMQIPAIYMLYLTVEEKIEAENIIKEIKIYNFIYITRSLSKALHTNMFAPFVQLAQELQRNVKDKSIFFAFETLKYCASFISGETANRSNQQQIADAIFPFHRIKHKDELSARFVYEVLRPGGYIERDRERQIRELSLHGLNQIASKDLIPFNSLYKNWILRLS